MDFKTELKSFIYTLIAFLITEGIWDFQVFQGDFSGEALKALLGAFIRAFLKAAIVLSFPALKTLISSNIKGENSQLK